MGEGDGANLHNSGEGGEGNPTFHESLGDHGTNELFTGIENVGGLAGKAIELSTELGELRDSQPVIPESVDGYSFDVVEGAGAIPDDVVADVKAFALEKGWSDTTFKQALEIEQAMGKKQIDAHNTAIEEKQTALKQEMGDAYEPGVQLVEQVLTRFGGEGIKERASDLASDPDVFTLIHAIGKAISPDTLESAGNMGGGGSEGDKNPAAVLYNGK